VDSTKEEYLVTYKPAKNELEIGYIKQGNNDSETLRKYAHAKSFTMLHSSAIPPAVHEKVLQ
jgi:hypothetical protein